MQKDNSHRSLQGLVSVNAWFSQYSEDDHRFTLHADVAFVEERLGGDSETKVVFRIAVKKCQIIFFPPDGAEFKIDPASVRSPRPLNPKAVSEKSTKVGKVGGKGGVAVASNSLEIQAGAEAAGAVETFQEASSEQLHGMYNEIWKMVKGNHAWEVDGRELENNRLTGPVFDAHNEPRLTLVDWRTSEKRSKDLEDNIPPVATIKVSCLREDLDIYDELLPFGPRRRNMLMPIYRFRCANSISTLRR